ncbi:MULTISPECIES: hypothetical protein [unclassified Lysinibacillus]|uniref:hypothetical protein n=1 Tax=unclassified Lysinibacillus TaxID=2636778 RepID=UPI0038148DCE
MGLWMVRSNPGSQERITDFLMGGIIAVHWGIGDLTGCKTKEDVAKVVAQKKLEARDASLKTGLLYKFVNEMKIGDLCLVPNGDEVYVGEIVSNYHFDSGSKGFEHQRKVRWHGGELIWREDLPGELQKSLRSRLALADITKHEELFNKYLNSEPIIEVESDDLYPDLELIALWDEAIQIIKNEINSDDPDRRLKAAIAVIGLNGKKNLDTLLNK